MAALPHPLLSTNTKASSLARSSLDGSFNWHNTSVLFHDMPILLTPHALAQLHLREAAPILPPFRTVWPTDAR